MLLRGSILFILLLTGLACQAQNDDLMKQDSVKSDTLKNGILTKDGKVIPVDSIEVTTDKPVTPIKDYADRFNPRKASLYAMVLPGLGQIYTKKYWKAPLVMGGMGFMAYAVTAAAKEYTYYKNELFQAINSPNPTAYRTKDGIDEGQLRTYVTQLRRQRDYFLIINFFIYVLQIVDAHVDAHLKEFDLNPNLKVSFQSIPTPTATFGGVALNVSYKLGK